MKANFLARLKVFLKNIFLKTNEFNKEEYINEMKTMVSDAINKINKENLNFEIFSVSIWTDPNAACSSINLDSKKNSDEKIRKSNERNKKYYDEYLAKGDLDQAKLFEPTETRNCNPADFELTNFLEIKNNSFSIDWEDNSNGNCWDILEPNIKEIGEYAFNLMKKLNVHPEFELSVNGRQDWYEFVWN